MQHRAKDLFKVAYSITDVGHKKDEEDHKATKESMEKRLKNKSDYKRNGGLLPSLIVDSDKFSTEVARNRAAYLERKHKSKENSYNPFAGMSDSSYYRG